MPLCSHDSYPCKARFALCFVCYRHIYSVSYSISTTPELTSKAYGNRPTSRGTASLRHSEVPGDIAVPLPIRFGDFQNPRGQTPIKDVPTLVYMVVMLTQDDIVYPFFSNHLTTRWSAQYKTSHIKNMKWPHSKSTRSVPSWLHCIFHTHMSARCVYKMLHLVAALGCANFHRRLDIETLQHLLN